MQTIKQYAMSLGTAARKSRNESLVHAKAYHEADKDGKAALKNDWMVGHVSGFMHVSLEQADKIVQRGKGAGAKADNVRAIDRAYADFRFHILKNGVEAKVVKAKADISVPAEILKLAAALVAACNEYEGSAQLIAAAIKAAK